jgi:hypothetical protein
MIDNRVSLLPVSVTGPRFGAAKTPRPAFSGVGVKTQASPVARASKSVNGWKWFVGIGSVFFFAAIIASVLNKSNPSSRSDSRASRSPFPTPGSKKPFEKSSARLRSSFVGSVGLESAPLVAPSRLRTFQPAPRWSSPPTPTNTAIPGTAEWLAQKMRENDADSQEGWAKYYEEQRAFDEQANRKKTQHERARADFKRFENDLVNSFFTGSTGSGNAEHPSLNTNTNSHVETALQKKFKQYAIEHASDLMGSEKQINWGDINQLKAIRARLLREYHSDKAIRKNHLDPEVQSQYRERFEAVDQFWKSFVEGKRM